VTPFRYTRLVFAFAIALVVFDETIEPLTLLGVAIVIATGLYSLWRERQARG
jgi:drug/metabolite transporter (DMT)-like permease